jgi:ferritin-like metal-binding protein YciE
MTRAASAGLPNFYLGPGLDGGTLFLCGTNRSQLLQEENMPNDGLKKLYVDELKDLYSAENQLVKALPKMAKAASSEQLRKGFEQHLDQTKGHVARLEQIFRSLGESPKGKKCMGMEGLIKEGAEVIGEKFEDAVMDAALIGAAQRVEHYEIAAYGTVREFARILDEPKHASLLEQTLAEEKETDEKLTEVSKQVNTQAIAGNPDESRINRNQLRKMPKRVA